jgi:uncharacterized protein YcfJ
MKRSTKKTALIATGAAVLALIAGSVGAYIYQNRAATTQVSQAAPRHIHHAAAPEYAQAAPAAGTPKCNDSNIVGLGLGALGGGLLGHQIGHGSGKTVATIGGAAAGAYVGQQYIPTNGVACRH